MGCKTWHHESSTQRRFLIWSHICGAVFAPIGPGRASHRRVLDPAVHLFNSLTPSSSLTCAPNLPPLWSQLRQTRCALRSKDEESTDQPYSFLGPPSVRLRTLSCSPALIDASFPSFFPPYTSLLVITSHLPYKLRTILQSSTLSSCCPSRTTMHGLYRAHQTSALWASC